MRREMLRAEHALSKMDPVRYPWQAHGLKLWMTDFFIPCIHCHHDNEEQIVGPYFKAKGEPSPVWGDTKSHKELLEIMEDVVKHCNKLSQAAVMLETPRCTEGDKATVRAAHASLLTLWATFKEYTWTHLAEEERVWPAIYARHGEKAQKEVLNKILSTDMARKGKEGIAFQMMLGSVLDGLGMHLAWGKEGPPPTPAHALHMHPWVARGQDHFPVPWIPGTFIFPGWQRRYVQTWKALIDSCSGPENVTGVTAQGFPAPVGCCGGA